MKQVLAMTVVGWLAALAASANQYEVRFEGDCLPENQPGWERCYGGGGATRWIEADQYGNSYYAVDSLADQMIYDYAEMDRSINPTEPGERFFCEWRMLVAEHEGYRQSCEAIAPDQYGMLGFGYTYDHISNTEGWSYPIVSGAFHTYRLESTDMVAYKLWIDGGHVRDGTWDLNATTRSYVTFGDGTQGGGSRSLVKWDYYWFGVVPEPGAAILLLVVWACGVHRPR